MPEAACVRTSETVPVVLRHHRYHNADDTVHLQQPAITQNVAAPIARSAYRADEVTYFIDENTRSRSGYRVLFVKSTADSLNNTRARKRRIVPNER